MEIIKMGDNLSPEDKELENKYRIRGYIFRFGYDMSNKPYCELFIDEEQIKYIKKDLEHIQKQIEEKSYQEACELNPEDIKF